MIQYAKARRDLLKELSQSKDVLTLDFEIASRPSCLIYVDGLSDKELTDRNIIEPLKRVKELSAPAIAAINSIICIADPIGVPKDVADCAVKIADGDIALVIDGAEELYVLSMRSYKTRGITEPPVSTVLRGPREGFVEDMKTNMTMVRRRLRSPKLKFDYSKIGQYTQSNIAICWLEGVADNKIVKQITDKINAIVIDGLIDSTYVARYLETNKYSLFTQIGLNEKPDIVAAKLLEGRVAIIVDGSPTVLTVPFVLFEHFQSSEDYYIKGYRASMTRIVRLIAMIIAIALPAAYVSLQEFQYQMLPLKMMITIMNNIYGLPLTPTLEMLLLLVIFEILNETSIRMPRFVGTALSIVGAIVLGEAAVNAGLLSTPSLLVTAISTIGLYAVPDEVNAASVLRMLFVLVSGVLGLFGLLLAIIAMVAYLATMQSYGTCYLMPFAPLFENDMQDGFIKSNLVDMKKRPYTIPTKNRKRSQ